MAFRKDFMRQQYNRGLMELLMNANDDTNAYAAFTPTVYPQIWCANDTLSNGKKHAENTPTMRNIEIVDLL